MCAHKVADQTRLGHFVCLRQTLSQLYYGKALRGGGRCIWQAWWLQKHRVCIARSVEPLHGILSEDCHGRALVLLLPVDWFFRFRPFAWG